MERQKPWITLLLLIAILPMAGCESIKVFDNGCEWTSYIYVSKGDTEETLRQTLAHNLTRKELCND